MRLLKKTRNATLADASLTMTASSKLPRIVLVLCLVAASTLTASQAQSTAPSTPIEGPPGTGPAAGSVPSKLTPTGLAANGGSIAQDVYTNSIYGFTMNTPPGWVVLPSNRPNPNDDPARLKQAEITRTLLVITENLPLKKSYQRRNIQILATPLSGKSAPDSAIDYLNYSQRATKEKNLPVEYQGSPEEQIIHGEKLAKVRSTDKTEGEVVYLEQYVVFRNHTLIQFFLESPNENGLEDLEPSIQSLKFTAQKARPSPKHSASRKKAAPTTNP